MTAWTIDSRGMKWFMVVFPVENKRGDSRWSREVDEVDTVSIELDDYVLVNAKLAYSHNENTELYLRGENLLDQQYQTVAGYGTPGISVFSGVKARF